MAKTALVVDDSKSIRLMVGLTLKDAGFEVVECENGQLALAAVSSRRFDLVITDLNMPVMDGISFIRAMRGNPQCKFTPVLMLTTESNAEKKKAGKDAGATGWIVKPFEPEKLLQTIGKVLV